LAFYQMIDSAHRPTRLLVVEPEPVHLEALREHLQSTDGDTELCGAGELAGALERLSGGGVDAVIIDPDLPDNQGIVSFERMYAFAPNVPVVVLTNEGGDDLAVRAVQGGAQDCMRKEEAQPSILLRSVSYAIERHRLPEVKPSAGEGSASLHWLARVAERAGLAGERPSLPPETVAKEAWRVVLQDRGPPPL
jgi:DNA-binding NtrC family response regulator